MERGEGAARGREAEQRRRPGLASRRAGGRAGRGAGGRKPCSYQVGSVFNINKSDRGC
jgi:hypothetical protein